MVLVEEAAAAVGVEVVKEVKEQIDKEEISLVETQGGIILLLLATAGLMECATTTV